ncbi:hypothetical protein N7509_004481 [Penicillium cosmopolitanum]|uniref:Uncharacterized protein n=1 Tax=Penicillium cosmopolitanum TaxID=1131564 RepID=A0A9W9W6Z1_9EURO|nr:uncharacterized protein N7509_004481 [Penicillium cosmopolitanum]KAJ5404610.1 hypothetical protein N7509_004481 [Penicillium cosmopolitanum]
MSTPKPRATYFSNGQALERPPFTVRVSRFFNDAYSFIGLYTVSLFSLDPYGAAQNSQFNIHRPSTNSGLRGRGPSSYFGGGGGGGGGDSGPGYDYGSGCGGGARRIGRVDDVRGPECGSCR